MFSSTVPPFQEENTTGEKINRREMGREERKGERQVKGRI